MVQVGIVMGSDSDMAVMSKAADVLEELGISYEMRIISAHREPDLFFEWAKGAEDRGLKVIIAGAGMAAHLPGMCAALFPLPVIGIPMHTTSLGGRDSLYSIVQMPSGIPVATVAINGGKNAALLAAKILAVSDPGLLVEESDAASLVGTPGYVPPEMFTEAASDIYSLGLTLKAASFGRQLEDLDKGPSMEADTGAALFPAWWRILNKATDPTPSRRYQSAKALLKDLAALRRKMLVSAVLGTRMAKAVVVTGAIAVVAVVILTVVSSRHAQRELAEQSEKFKLLEQFKTKQQEKFALKLLNHLDEEAKGSIYPVESLDALGIPREISVSDFEVYPTVTVAERKRRDSFWEACSAGKPPYRAKLRVSEAKEKVAKVIQANRDVAKATQLQSP